MAASPTTEYGGVRPPFVYQHRVELESVPEGARRRAGCTSDWCVVCVPGVRWCRVELESTSTWRRDGKVRLAHEDVGAYLHCHNMQYGRPIAGQFEVSMGSTVCCL